VDRLLHGKLIVSNDALPVMLSSLELTSDGQTFWTSARLPATDSGPYTLALYTLEDGEPGPPWAMFRGHAWRKGALPGDCRLGLVRERDL
jgi:hypothetical protein